MKQNILVSVIIPTYNKRSMIKRALDSVLFQTYKNIEIIVVDDGSTDGTSREVATYGIDEEPSIIKYYYKENGGCASALNYGINKAKGELITWLSGDDWYESTMIEESVKAHLDNPGAGMTYTNYNIQNKNGLVRLYESYQPKDKQDAINKLNEVCYINGSSIMVKREVFWHIGKFNPAFRYAQDYDFYYRVINKYPIHLIEKPLLNYWDNTGTNHLGWLGKEIADGNHTNEGEPVRERYKFMFEDNRQKVCAMICMKNEEELIKQCLDDLIMYVDYIVIFNDGSTDKSLEIVKQYHKVVDIYTAKHKGNKRTEGYDRQKLLTMAQKTKADWFFMIDADEVMEDRFKTEIWKEIKAVGLNMYHYRSYNFWRTDKQYRVDEMWFQGWFAKLFRNMKGLKYNVKENEHCGSIPMNIPGAPQWFDPVKSKKAAKSQIRIKHYGYADWNRTEKKYRELMQRDKKPPEGRHSRYDRMVTDTNAKFEVWYEEPYYLPNGVTEQKSLKVSRNTLNVKAIDEEIHEKKILFVGVGNVCRSLMAMQLARKMGFKNADSAGTNPNPEIFNLTTEVLQEMNCSPHKYRSKSLLSKKKDGYDVIVVINEDLKDKVQDFEGEMVVWDIPDPSSEYKDINDIEIFRNLRDVILSRLEELK